jgi:hypothetical protein
VCRSWLFHRAIVTIGPGSNYDAIVYAIPSGTIEWYFEVLASVHRR